MLSKIHSIRFLRTVLRNLLQTVELSASHVETSLQQRSLILKMAANVLSELYQMVPKRNAVKTSESMMTSPVKSFQTVIHIVTSVPSTVLNTSLASMMLIETRAVHTYSMARATLQQY